MTEKTIAQANDVTGPADAAEEPEIESPSDAESTEAEPELAAQATEPIVTGPPEAVAKYKKLPAEARAKWKSTNALQLVDEVYDRLRRFPQIGAPENINCTVYTIEGGSEMMLPGTFELIAVRPQDGLTAGQRLYDYLIDRFHMTRNSAISACWYKIVLQWKRSGRWVAVGRVRLPGADEIRAFRRAANDRAEAERIASMASQYGAPYAGAGAPPPTYAPSAQPRYAAPPPAPAPGAPIQPAYEQAALMYKLGQLQVQLEETMRAVREGPPMPPQGPAMPPPAAPAAPLPAPAPAPQTIGHAEVRQMIGEAMTDFAKQIASELGIGPRAGTGAPTYADKLRTQAEGMVERVIEKGFQQIGKVFEESVSKAAGFGYAPIEPAAAEPAEPEMPPPDPKDSLPFELIPTGAKWPDGQDVMWSQNRETGDFDVRGAGFGNPFLVTTGKELGLKLVDVAKTIAERWTSPTKAHVVGSIPSNARPADAAPPPANGAPPRWPTP